MCVTRSPELKPQKKATENEILNEFNFLSGVDNEDDLQIGGDEVDGAEPLRTSRPLKVSVPPVFYAEFVLRRRLVLCCIVATWVFSLLLRHHGSLFPQLIYTSHVVIIDSQCFRALLRVQRSSMTPSSRWRSSHSSIMKNKR